MRHLLLSALALSLLFLPGRAGPAFPTQDAPGTDDPLYHELEALGWDLTDAHKVPGVGIARIVDGEIAWGLGCGYENLETEELVTPETVFNIGSISKTVAAWGAMRLVEAGEVELDAPISVVLTRWKLPQSEFDGDGVTLRRLLSHTAGLSLHGYPGFEPGERLPSLEESLSGATNGPGGVELIHAPGSQWKYSGGGYTMTQLMIEEVTGRDFAEYMRATVLEPLGMESSDYGWTERVDRLAATPYDEHGQPIGGPRFTALAAAGLQTSVLDLARFGAATLATEPEGTHGALTLATLASMLEPAPASPGYGLGYQVSEIGGVKIAGHGGSNRGWIASLSLVPEMGDGLVVLTNGSNGQRLIGPMRAAWAASLMAREAATTKD